MWRAMSLVGIEGITSDGFSGNISVVCGSPLGAKSTITTTCTSDLKDEVSGNYNPANEV